MHSHTNTPVTEPTEAHGVKGLMAKAKAVLPGHKEAPATTAHRHEHDLTHNSNHTNIAASGAHTAHHNAHTAHQGGLVGNTAEVEDNRGMAAALGATGYTVPPSHKIHDPAHVHDDVTAKHIH
ncbi:hypothetical protein HDU86_004501 [Geranomyces michiganensis]|nr:hypothetical protein HDU86_004501 [Geranomyces michiganensis]